MNNVSLSPAAVSSEWPERQQQEEEQEDDDEAYNVTSKEPNQQTDEPAGGIESESEAKQANPKEAVGQEPVQDGERQADDEHTGEEVRNIEFEIECEAKQANEKEERPNGQFFQNVASNNKVGEAKQVSKGTVRESSRKEVGGSASIVSQKGNGKIDEHPGKEKEINCSFRTQQQIFRCRLGAERTLGP